MNYPYTLLTAAERRRIENDNAKHHWGFCVDDVYRFLYDFSTGDEKAKAAVIYRFEDVNYHTLANCLDEGDWEGVAKEMVAMFGEFEMKKDENGAYVIPSEREILRKALQEIVDTLQGDTTSRAERLIDIATEALERTRKEVP